MNKSGYDPGRKKAPVFETKTGASFSNEALLLLPGHVDGLLALATGGDLELHCLALTQAPETISLDLAVMDEDVLAVFRGYESIALAVVEPFDCSFSHSSQLLIESVNRGNMSEDLLPNEHNSLPGPVQKKRSQVLVRYLRPIRPQHLLLL